MAYETKNTGENGRNSESLYTQRIRAGKRRTYFFDVRATRGNDYFLTITESKRRFDDKGFDRHKIFLYKEDFNKFILALNDTVDYVKTELMPDFDFDAYNQDPEEENTLSLAAEPVASMPPPSDSTVEVESSTGDNDNTGEDDNERLNEPSPSERTYFNVSSSEEEEPQGSSVEDWKL